jgi:indole-3-pyruvate monooxygenase
MNVVDDLLVRLSNSVFGDLSRHGIVRPKIGPLFLKAKTCHTPKFQFWVVNIFLNIIIRHLNILRIF